MISRIDGISRIRFIKIKLTNLGQTLLFVCKFKPLFARLLALNLRPDFQSLFERIEYLYVESDQR